jgi:hypothetical protein
MATFLQLTNRVLERFNEPRLSSANFVGAVGFRQHAKQCVNDAIDEINNQQWEWPFNHTYTETTLTIGQQIYPLAATTKTVDWDTFQVTGFGRSANLTLISYDQWSKNRRCLDEVAQTSDYNFPNWVARTQGNEFLISPKPDKAYIVKYERWILPTELVLPTDIPVIPYIYDSTIVNGAMKYAYLFRENFEASATMGKLFDNEVRAMRNVLIYTPPHFTDTRI